MRIMAVRQIAGDYGMLRPGQVHPNVADHIADELIRNGLAIEAVYSGPGETQLLVPVEVPLRAVESATGGPKENKSARTGRI